MRGRSVAGGFVALAALLWAFVSIPPSASLPGPATPAGVAAQPVAATNARIRFARPSALSLPDGRARTVRSLLRVTRPMRFGDYVWDETGIEDGPLWVRVDLATQTISAFRGEHEIGTSLILYGTDDKPTPTGIFPILGKAAVHQSTLYDAPMPFMLRLTGDGAAIHASAVRRGAATHGCIGVPLAFARLLFAVAHRGDPVAILPASGKPLPSKTRQPTARQA